MPEEHIEHKVKTEESDLRLDLYLRTIGVRLSRTKIIEIIKKGMVKVNGKKSKPSYKIKAGDFIVVDYYKLTKEDVKPENIPLNIIYEDEDIIVINKDKNMVVHPAKGNREGTLVNALLYHSHIKGGESFRPGVVHRLDKDTTGAMVFAKNEESHKFLSYEIEKRRVKRIYLAIVWGNIFRKRGIIDAPIGRSIMNRKLMTVTPVKSRKAITEYIKIKSFEIATFVKLILQTGRTHQIRVHMSYINHPVIGDDFYAKNALSSIKNISIDKKEHYHYIQKLINRQALHAAILEFKHPRTKNVMRFYATMPKDMRDIINYLYKLEKK